MASGSSYSNCRGAKIFYLPQLESNPGRWIYRQTLYHVAVKAGFYRKAVGVYYIPRPCDIHPLQYEIRPRISWYRNHVKMNPREIFMHRKVIGWVIYGGCHCRRAKIFYLPQLGIEPRSLDLQANTLPRRCRSRLLQRRGRVFAFRSCGPGSNPTSGCWDFSAPCDLYTC